jgi:hypothetical protein
MRNPVANAAIKESFMERIFAILVILGSKGMKRH